MLNLCHFLNSSQVQLQSPPGADLDTVLRLRSMTCNFQENDIKSAAHYYAVIYGVLSEGLAMYL